MDLEIQYGGVNRSIPLEAHVEEKISKVARRADLDRGRVRVWLDRESAFISRGLPKFITRIVCKHPGRAAVFVKAESNQLAESVNQAAKNLSRRLTKSKKGGFYGKKN